MSESSVSGVQGISVATAFAGMRSVAPVLFKACLFNNLTPPKILSWVILGGGVTFKKNNT